MKIEANVYDALLDEVSKVIREKIY